MYMGVFRVTNFARNREGKEHIVLSILHILVGFRHTRKVHETRRRGKSKYFSTLSLTTNSATSGEILFGVFGVELLNLLYQIFVRCYSWNLLKIFHLFKQKKIEKLSSTINKHFFLCILWLEVSCKIIWTTSAGTVSEEQCHLVWLVVQSTKRIKDSVLVQESSVIAEGKPLRAVSKAYQGRTSGWSNERYSVFESSTIHT